MDRHIWMVQVEVKPGELCIKLHLNPCYSLIWRQDLTKLPKLTVFVTMNLLCSTGGPSTYHPPASASKQLSHQACTAHHSFLMCSYL